MRGAIGWNRDYRIPTPISKHDDYFLILDERMDDGVAQAGFSPVFFFSFVEPGVFPEYSEADVSGGEDDGVLNFVGVLNALRIRIDDDCRFS